jgi:hypothetical protein
MNESNLNLLLIACLGLLAILVTVVSIQTITQAKLYRKIPDDWRPSKRVVAFFFSYFVVFCLWFSVWYFARGSILSYILGFTFFALTAVIVIGYAIGRVRDIFAFFLRVFRWASAVYRDRSDARKR